MNKPQIKIDSIEVNIKAPQQLHVVRPHSARKSNKSNDIYPQTIKQQQTQCQQKNTPAHRIKHIEAVEDKGEFIDETSHSRVSQKDQARETITRTIHPQPDLPLNDSELQKITEQVVNEEQNSKPLKHFNVENIIDRDEFNMRNSRQKFTEQRKRRLSQTNVKGYIDQNNHLFGDRVAQLNTNLSQKVIEEENHTNDKQKPASTHRKRKSSLHSAHQGVSEQINRMIVDELDKKKKSRNQQQNQDDDEQPSMQAIKEEKQEEDVVCFFNLEQARDKIEQQISTLSKVVGQEVGPEDCGKHLYMEKQESIEQEGKDEKQQ